MLIHVHMQLEEAGCASWLGPTCLPAAIRPTAYSIHPSPPSALSPSTAATGASGGRGGWIERTANERASEQIGSMALLLLRPAASRGGRAAWLGDMHSRLAQKEDRNQNFFRLFHDCHFCGYCGLDRANAAAACAAIPNS